MDNKVAVEILMDIPHADAVMGDGLAEVVFRESDARFSEMIKCKVLGQSVSGERIPQKLVDAAMSMISENAEGIDEIKNSLRLIAKNEGALTTTIKNISTKVDGIYNLTKTVRNISFLNTGLSLANMAIDVAGFAVVTDKLNELNTKLNALNSEVQQISIDVSAVRDMLTIEKLAEFSDLIAMCASNASDIQAGIDVDLKDLRGDLRAMRKFIIQMIMTMQVEALSYPLVLEMVFTLMPAYTFLLREYLRSWYFQHKAIPQDVKIWLSLYGDIVNANIFERMQDYYFLEERLHVKDVIDIKDSYILLCLNGRVQIEDQVTVLEKLKAKEKVLQFDKVVDDYTKLYMQKNVPVLARMSDMDVSECGRYLDA